jgi:hypothetical protein
MARFKRKLTLGCVIVAGSFIAYLLFRSGWDSQEQQAKAFCESLVAAIDQSRSAHGTYPTNFDSAWLEGRSVPAMIRTQDFYFSRGDRFFLRFYRPGLRRHAFHNVLCYDSHEHEWFRQYEY